MERARAELLAIAADHRAVDLLVDATRTRDAVSSGTDADLALLDALERATAAVSWQSRAGGAARRAGGVLIPRPAGRMRGQAAAVLPAVQRRGTVRVSAVLRAAVITGERSLLSRTVNVGAGGMLVAPAETLAVGDVVRFAIDLRGITVTGDGTVLRAEPQGGRAIRFDGLDARAVNAIAAFVARRQRELLADVAA